MASALDYRDEVIDAALPVRRDPAMSDYVIYPEDSYGRRGYPLPHTGVLDEPAPPVERIPPSPWNRPKVDLEKGWYDSPNDPVSDEPPGAKYQSDFLSPAERGYIKAGASSSTFDDGLIAPRDNRDMQVQAPGQPEFPKQGTGPGLLLHPNAAGIYGYENRPPPAGDVVIPPDAGSRNADKRNAYILNPARYADERKLNEYKREEIQRTDGFRRVRFIPVDHDPFEGSSFESAPVVQPKLVPVDYDPFADPFKKPSPAEIIGMGLPTFGGGSALGGFAQNAPAQSGFGGSQPSLSTMSPPGGDGFGGPPQQNSFRPPAGVSN
jgi:hypothetical protein